MTFKPQCDIDVLYHFLYMFYLFNECYSVHYLLDVATLLYDVLSIALTMCHAQKKVFYDKYVSNVVLSLFLNFHVSFCIFHVNFL